jgi:hypothetical protein
MIANVIDATQKHGTHEEPDEERFRFIEQHEQHNDASHEAEEDETFMVNRDISERLKAIHLSFSLSDVVIIHQLQDKTSDK